MTNMSTFLNEKYGYRREDMVILTDDQKNPMSIPNKANILRAKQWLVKDAQPNDSLFIHFSGHGGRTPDLDGDEEDGKAHPRKLRRLLLTSQATMMLFTRSTTAPQDISWMMICTPSCKQPFVIFLLVNTDSPGFVHYAPVSV